MSEREHLVLLNNLIPRAYRSRLLPVWRFAGFSLGLVAALNFLLDLRPLNHSRLRPPAPEPAAVSPETG